MSGIVTVLNDNHILNYQKQWLAKMKKRKEKIDQEEKNKTSALFADGMIIYVENKKESTKYLCNQ